MKFKQWINSLSLAHLKALAYQCTLSWKLSRPQLVPLLVKSVGAKDMFRDFGMENVSTGGVDHKEGY